MRVKSIGQITPHITLVGWLTFLCLGVGIDAPAQFITNHQFSTNNISVSSDATVQLQVAVRRFSIWLAHQPDAAQWRRILLVNVLETQSALGEQADVATLWKVHQCFSQPIAALSKIEFADVRRALRNQIELLSRSQNRDLFHELAIARANYVPISTADMSLQRELLKSELRALKQFYQQSLPTDEKKELFQKLQIDQTLEYLDGIEFKLAPEVSVGKVQSLINAEQKKLDKIVEQIDALPLIDEDGEFDDDDEETPTPDDSPALGGQITEIDDAGPGPDNDDLTLEELEKQQELLEERIEKMKAQLRELRKEDQPRRRERLKTLEMLRKFEKRFLKLSESQHDPNFVSTAIALGRFFRIYFYGTDDNLQEDFLNELQKLEENLQTINYTNQRAMAGQIGESLRWLENANQAPTLVAAIRSRYSFPNIYVHVSSRLVNQAGSQPVQDSQPIDETIRGRKVRGTTDTSGSVQINLQPDANQIHANIDLMARLSSKTYLDQGRLRVYAGAQGGLRGQRRIFANLGGLYADAPSVSANVNAFFRGTSSRFRFINRIANRKFEKERATTNADATQRARTELYKKFSQQTDMPIADGQAALARGQDQLAKNARFVPELFARSFSNQVLVVGKKSSIATLGAPSYPPRLNVPSDFSVRLHDTFLTNYLHEVLSGQTFSDQELAERIASLTGQSPSSLALTPNNDDEPDEEGDEDEKEDESFSIKFARVHPIQFQFENNGFLVVISGEQFFQGDKRYDSGVKISMRFKIIRVNGQLKLIRDGLAELESINPKKEKPTDVAFRSALEGRLNPKDSDSTIEIDLPTNLLPVNDVELLRNSPIAQRLHLVQCRSENGWLHLGWNYLPAPQQSVAWQYDLPSIWNVQPVFQQQPTYLGQNGWLQDSTQTRLVR